MAIITFNLNNSLFVRDPQRSDLGHRIIKESIILLDRIGYEEFTFKKLADNIGSTEASVYRYFENKHRLLLYLTDWYWTWIEYRINYETNNVSDPYQRLNRCLTILTAESQSDGSVPHVDETALQRIVTSEFEKTYLTKFVDADNTNGVFFPYKAVCRKLSTIILELNPRYAYPQSLVSTIMLAATHQLFYAEHLPSLTHINRDSTNQRKELYEFILDLINKSIGV